MRSCRLLRRQATCMGNFAIPIQRTTNIYGLPIDRGVFVTRVIPGSPAYNAEIVPGDIVLEFASEATNSIEAQQAQRARAPQLMLEHFIGPWVAVGIGTIFFFIGKFFGTIVGFVKARRQIISEGVETVVYYSTAKTSKKTVDTSAFRVKFP